MTDALPITVPAPGPGGQPVLSCREELTRAIRHLRPSWEEGPMMRWVLVEHALGRGASYSSGICVALGFDPDEWVNPAPPHEFICEAMGLCPDHYHLREECECLGDADDD